MPLLVWTALRVFWLSFGSAQDAARLAQRPESLPSHGLAFFDIVRAKANLWAAASSIVMWHLFELPRGMCVPLEQRSLLPQFVGPFFLAVGVNLAPERRNVLHSALTLGHAGLVDDLFPRIRFFSDQHHAELFRLGLVVHVAFPPGDPLRHQAPLVVRHFRPGHHLANPIDPVVRALIGIGPFPSQRVDRRVL